MRSTKKTAAPQPAKNEVIEAIKALAMEKDIDIELLFASAEAAIKAAYRKNQPKTDAPITNVSVNMSRTDGSIHIYAHKLVVEEVDDRNTQISLEDAKAIRPGAQLSDIVEVDVTPKGGFMRVAAQAAKQDFRHSLLTAEQGKTYNKFADKIDEILTAVVLRVEERQIAVELDRTQGVLLAGETIPGEELHEGDHIKVYVTNVQRSGAGSSQGAQIQVSRVHPNLVKRLFEMEVPEIAGGEVIIKSIAREAGSRTKMAVWSTNPMIDPVGACVGQHGARVDRVVKELRGEKIDIIKWSEDPVEFVANALNPAHVLTVYTVENEKNCRVVVPDQQLSLAIGKEGQNARLAAKLTGWKIDIKSESQVAALEDMIDESAMPALEVPEELPVSFSMKDDIDDSFASLDDDTL